MFGLGMGELLIILAIVLIIFGATRLPEIGRGLGSGIKEFQKGIKNGDTQNSEKPSIENDEKKKIDE